MKRTRRIILTTVLVAAPISAGVISYAAITQTPHHVVRMQDFNPTTTTEVNK